MTLERLKTDKRWWFWISLVLFVIPWFLPILVVAGSSMSPGDFSVTLLKDPGHIGGTLTVIGTFTLLIGVPSIPIAWVLQDAIVRIRSGRENESQNPGWQNHWSERGRATSVANADAQGHLCRSVLELACKITTP